MHIILTHAARVAVAVLGLALIVLGLVLWLIPIIPGFGLVFVGLPMVMAVHPKGRRLAKLWKKRAFARLQRLKTRWRNWRRGSRRKGC